jgi:CheY-like chemotaxis protein
LQKEEELTMITRHILLMDKNPIISDLLSQLLEEELNMQVTVLGTILEDVTEIKELQPDLILVALRHDVILSQVWTCVQHLKSDQATKDIPVVLYNGYTIELHEYYTQECKAILTQPGIDFIFQPLDVDAFNSHIRSLLTNLPSII